MNQRPTVFVVDSDHATCQAVRDLAGTMNLPCEVYSSGQTFFDTLDDSRPGCLVMDLHLPGIDGLQLQRRLCHKGIGLPVIFLATRTEVSIAVEAMRMGAVHFLEKPFRSHEVWNAIQEAIDVDRRRRQSQEERRRLETCLAPLTARQRQVLSLLGEGKSNHEIAEELKVTDRTVEMHRARLMKALHLTSLRELVDLAILAHSGNGMEAEPESLLEPWMATEGKAER